MVKFIAVALLVIANAAFAQDADKKTASVTTPSAETCKPICMKAKDTTLITDSDKSFYQECFKKRLCEAGRLIHPLAKDNKGGLFEILLGMEKG